MFFSWQQEQYFYFTVQTVMEQRNFHNKLIFTMPGTFLASFLTKIMTQKRQSTKQTERKQK